MSLRDLLTPDRLVRHVSEVSPIELAEVRGIRAVICDLDNTLAEWHSETIDDEVRHWLRNVQETGLQVCIASNTRNFSRLERIATDLGIHHVPGNAGKPGTRGLRRALQMMEATPIEAAMIGDQLFTDIVAGNRAGIYTILVNPLSPREFIGTKWISRRLEQVVLRGALQRPV